MAEYIYTARNGIHIINLPKTAQCWERAKAGIMEIVSDGGRVLFVGTKKQAQDAVEEEAKRCGAYFVSKRWLGGMLTNFATIKKSIDRMNKISAILTEEEKLAAANQPHKFTKKERLMMTREFEKLDASIGGIREMDGIPDLLFVIDLKREDIAIKEAKKLGIPVVALVDTNCDPNIVEFPIPSNDDGTRAIRLFCAAVSDTVSDGMKRAGGKVRVRQLESNLPRAKRVTTGAPQLANVPIPGAEPNAPELGADESALLADSATPYSVPVEAATSDAPVVDSETKPTETN
jgi:small subunit ribosomal protein S2